MGAGASKNGEVVDDDEQYVQRPERKRSNEANQEPGPSSPHRGLQQRPSIKGQEEPVVSVSANGFAVPEITIMEGQTVTFLYEEARPTNNVIQVIHDGDKLRPVIGGFSCDINKCKGRYNQQFNLEGEYKFAINNVRCTPLTVVVKRRTDLLAEITDDGFYPKKIYIYQGHSIKWQWKQCTAPHSVQEVKYCIEKGCFKKEAENAEVVKTVTGSFRQTFTRPGLYFFQTESGEVEKVHHCAVHVRETQREYKVELLDRSFQPMILLIEEGDRVWWFWDKFKCKKLHNVYQIEAPTGEHGDDEPYEPVQNGFRSSVPSKQGLLSHEFYTPGVYYYSDQNFQEAAEYIGTIIVKPKQKKHYVEVTEKGFTQDVVHAQTGDRIWWTWDAEESLKRDHIFHISEVDKMLNPLAKLPTYENEKYHHLNEDAIRLCTSVGLATTQYTNIGVYNYRIANGPDSMNTCSVIVNPGPKNHTIHLTNNGFEPKVTIVQPNDRVWWVWQSSKKSRDIIQVSHQGKPIDDGFCSGQARDAPSAFMHQFMAPGVFYFISSVLPKVFGAIVVSTQPQVHEVNVALEIRPDPVTIKCNDIVCWIFRGLRSYDVAEIKNVDQLTTKELESTAVTPRRCISQAVQKTGVIHYYSKSFKRQMKESDNLMDDIGVSSVICDECYDSQVCRLDSKGFHPNFLYLTKGQSVFWTWKGNEEAHNIIHVSSPESKEPLNVISGPKAFNSGKPTPDNNFLYTCDEPGFYTVASQGAPGYSCIVFVLSAAGRVSDPFISSVDGGSVNSGTNITLGCDSPGSKIYFTIDGAPPELHLGSAKLYTEKGIKLKTPGLCFVRFMAVKEGFLNSHIITSRRYFVLPEESDTHDDTSDSDASFVSEKKPSPKRLYYTKMAFPQTRRQAQVPKPCDLCETDTNIKWKCVHCNTLMCDKCKNIHLKVQTSIRHDIVDAFNSKGGKDIEYRIITDNIPCQSHKKFNCMFCRTCDRFVCADCITAFHKTHDLDSIDTVCDERRQNLKQLRSRLFEKVARFETEEKQIQDLKTKYNNFLAESVEKINKHEQLIKVEVSKYANELRTQIESERQRIENSMLEKEKQCEKMKENLLQKQSDLQEVLESRHAVKVFTAQKEFCASEDLDAPFETLSDETKCFISQDNLKNISYFFGSLQKANLPKGSPQITFEVIKSYTTNLNTVEKVLILDDKTVWISNHVSSWLREINIDLPIKTIKNISVQVYDMARKVNNDIFLSLHDSTNVCLLTTKKGTIKPFLSVSPLITCGIHVSKHNEIILGVKDIGCPFKVTDKSCRKIIIFGMNGKQKQSYEYDKHKQRLFTIPVRITSNVNNDILLIDRISVQDWRVVAIDREGQVRWAYQGNPQVNSNKLFYPIDILTTSEGHVLVNDVKTNTLQVLSVEGDILTCYAMKDQGIFHQFSMDIDSKGQLWVGCHSGSEQRSDARLHVVKMGF